MPLADAATDALLEDWARICDALGQSAFRRESEKAAAMVTGVPIPTLNNVFTARPTATRFEVEALIRLVADNGLPHCLQLRPGSDADIRALPLDRGMTAQDPIPLMAIQAAAAREILEAPPSPLRIRQVSPEGVAFHTSLLAAGFAVPQQLFDRLITPAVLALPGVRCYVGSIESEPVTTALGFSGGDHVGIYNVATRPEHRGRGYGAAITARAVFDGFAAGASYAYLQSSTDGYRVYERLGFRELESWAVWIAAAVQSKP
jgi:N-acetylglutamate synthase